MRACLSVVVLFLALPAFAADAPVPKYEGKPLEYWLSRFEKAENEKDRVAAVEALKAFGPDAAPALPKFIEMLADHSPAYRAQVIDILREMGPKAEQARPIIVKLVKDKKTAPSDNSIKTIVAISAEPKDAVTVLIPLLDVVDVNYGAYCALCKIGPDPKESLPAIRKYILKELAAVENDPMKSLFGLQMLTELGPDVVPLLVEMLDAHSGVGRDDSLECLKELGPKATKAVPALLKLLKHDAPLTQFRAAQVLWRVEKHPAVIVTVAELLKTDPRIKCHSPGVTQYQRSYEPLAIHAANFLCEIGPEAKAALPQLREAIAIGVTFGLLLDGSESPFSAPTAPRIAPGLPQYAPGPGLAPDEEHSLWLNARARIEVARAALSAIAKIEAGPKK